MATNYPSAKDSFIRKIPNVDGILAAHVNNLQDATRAIEVKLGVDDSEVVNSIDFQLKNIQPQEDPVTVINLNVSTVDGANMDIDDTLKSNSDSKIPSQNAVRGYLSKILHSKSASIVLESPNGVCNVDPENKKKIRLNSLLRVLMPNGKHPNGDYKHIDFTLNSNLSMLIPFYDARSGVFSLHSNGTMSTNKTNILIQDDEPDATIYKSYWWYNEQENLYYESDGENWTATSVIVLGSFVTNGVGDILSLTTFISRNDRMLTHRDIKVISTQYPEYSSVASFNGTTDNVITMTGIVSELSLERGDVIEISGNCHEDNKKRRTVDEISSNDRIIVNYDHAGNRGNGVLRLHDENNKLITVQRIAKWHEAHTGLGREFVDSQFKLDLNESEFENILTFGTSYGGSLDTWGNDVYCCFDGNIYKQTNGAGSFVNTGLTAAPSIRGYSFCICNGHIFTVGYGHLNYYQNMLSPMKYYIGDMWAGTTALGRHGNSLYVVFASLTTGGGRSYLTISEIKKQTGGSGAFVTQTAPTLCWAGFTSIGNDVYACSRDHYDLNRVDAVGDIYKQTGGIGAFVALGQTKRKWTGITSHGGNLYACVHGGDIYKLEDFEGSFEPMGYAPRNWDQMKTLGNSIYATDKYNVYKLSYTENVELYNNSPRPIEVVTYGDFASDNIMKGYTIYQGQAQFDYIANINLQERR